MGRPDTLIGTLWCRSVGDLVRHKNIFAHRKVKSIVTWYTEVADATTNTTKLEFPGVPLKSTGVRSLWFSGFHFETISNVLKLPHKLGEFVFVYLPQDSSQISRRHRRTRPWPEITQDTITDGFSAIGPTVTFFSFVHKHMGAYPLGKVFTNVNQFAVAAWNLFPPGPDHWKHWGLLEMIPKTCEVLVITHCDFSLEVDGDITRQDPDVDYSKVVHLTRSLNRLAQCLKSNNEHSVRVVTVFFFGVTQRLMLTKFGDWSDSAKKRSPSIEDVYSRFVLKFFPKVEFQAQGMSQQYDF